MKQDEFARLERSFMGIRDERGIRANTAVRIGTAFLELLRYASIGEFEEISFKKVINKPEFLQGLTALGSIVLGEYVEGLKGGIITPEGAAELKDLWVREHIKAGDGSEYHDAAGRVIPALEVKGDSTFTGNLSSPEFVSAFFGGLGWAIQKKPFENAAGEIEYRYTLEIDNAVIRNTLRVFEMIISQLLGENANRYFSDQMEVDHYDPETKRVYLKTHDGRMYNPFRKDDIIACIQYNHEPTEANGWYVTKSYEMLVTAVGIGNESDGEDRLDWLEFTDFKSQMDGASPKDVIKEWDTFVRADNKTNPARKGIISVMAVGESTPYIDILYGLKTDPAHALKGRLGNLEGIRTDLFGWLEGFGAYINNFYGVGKFFNMQTGESLTARVEMLKERYKTLYTETTYNISDEDNFITNGFFQKLLEGWTPCDILGNTEDVTKDIEVLGYGGEAFTINGHPLAVVQQTKAEMAEMDGIRVLHLRGMGVAQDFSLIKANGSHDVMSSEDESTDTTSEPDRLYMGVRILPRTAGRLTVHFVKDSGKVTGWEKQLSDSLDWQLYQSQDFAEMPWDYTDTGKLVIHYTGECYIRFVALQTDAIANSKVQYSTLFEQTSRRINQEARRLSSDLNVALAQVEIRFDQIEQTVTDNYSAFTTAKKDLQDEIAALDASVDEYNSMNDGKWASFSTWQSQTNKSIGSFAAALTVDGKIGSLSAFTQSVDNLTGRVQSVESGLSTANGNIESVTDRVSSLEVTDRNITQRVAAVETKATANATDISDLASEMNGVESSVGKISSRVGVLETTNTNITQRVSAIESRPLPISDIDAWELGTTSERAGLSYDQVKDPSTTRVRTKGLYPVTDATTCVFSNTGRTMFDVFFVFFNSAKVVSSIKTGSGWYSQPSDGLKIALNAPTDAAYVAILLKKKTGETITLDDVRSSGITITSDTVITSAQISTFITRTDLGDYVSWAEMKADNISFEFTKEWRVGVKGKGTVMKLDTDGNLMIAGTFSQNVAIDGIRTSSDGTIERYNPNTGWTTMFAARYVRYVSSTTYLNKDDDYVIAGNGTFDIYLPSGSKNGKIISIKNLNDGIIVRAQGSDKIVQFDSNNAAQWKDLDNYDRAELVYYNQKWYWNYMEV